MSTKDELKRLSALSDDELLVRLSDASKQSRRGEAALVAHIAEVDARRLYAREASPSMFRFCTDVLHLSEAEAYRRINAARLSRRFPVLLTMLEDGRIHLCGIAVISKHLTEAHCEEVLARSQAFRQDESSENECRRRRHVTGCPRHRCRGEAFRVGTRRRAMYVCHA